MEDAPIESWKIDPRDGLLKPPTQRSPSPSTQASPSVDDALPMLELQRLDNPADDWFTGTPNTEAAAAEPLVSDRSLKMEAAYSKLPIKQLKRLKARNSGSSSRRHPRDHRSKPDSPAWSKADKCKWLFSETEFNGRLVYVTRPSTEDVTGPIAVGVERLRMDHSLQALYYQDDMLEWPPEEQIYSIIKRVEGSGVRVEQTTDGGFIWADCKYQVRLSLLLKTCHPPDCETCSLTLQVTETVCAVSRSLQLHKSESSRMPILITS